MDFNEDFTAFLAKTDTVQGLIQNVTIEDWEENIEGLFTEVPGLETALEEMKEASDQVERHDDVEDRVAEYYNLTHTPPSAGCLIGCYATYFNCIHSQGCNGLCLFWCELFYARCRNGCAN